MQGTTWTCYSKTKPGFRNTRSQAAPNVSFRTEAQSAADNEEPEKVQKR